MNREKMKVGIVVGVLVLCVVWLTYYWLSAPPDPSKNAVKPLNSPAWTWANGINDKLVTDKRFADTSVVVVTDSPEKFKIVGMVHTTAELKALKDLVTGEASDKDIDWEVGVPAGR